MAKYYSTLFVMCILRWEDMLPKPLAQRKRFMRNWVGEAGRKYVKCFQLSSYFTRANLL